MPSAPLLLALLLGGCDDGKPPADDTGPPVDTGPTDADGDGWTVAGGDCDDGDPAVWPGAEEVVADAVDQDCDGGDTCWADEDGDMVGSIATVRSEDRRCTGKGESRSSTDCDDADPSVYSGAREGPADGIDQDCDAGDLCYEDGDGDGVGRQWTVSSPDLDCAGVGESAVATDCDDTDASVGPGATESCHDGRDDDCDGLLDCEDGDCAKDAACGEDCVRPGDEDGDGLADCEDDECWGSACHPAGVRVRVLDGAFAGTLDSSQREGANCNFTPGGGPQRCHATGREKALGMRVRSIVGSVQVLPPGAASWAGTPTRTTCAWSAVSVAFAYSGYRLDVDCTHGHGPSGTYRYDADLDPPAHAGLRVDPGCRLAAGSWFLPDLLAPHCRAGEVGTVVYSMPIWGCSRAQGGPLWYVGDWATRWSVQNTAHWSTPGTTYCPQPDTHRRERVRRTYAGVLDPGSVYTAVP